MLLGAYVPAHFLLRLLASSHQWLHCLLSRRLKRVIKAVCSPSTLLNFLVSGIGL